MQKQEASLNVFGTIAFNSLHILIMLAAWKLGVLQNVAQDLWWLVTGAVEKIHGKGNSILFITLVIVTIVTLKIPISGWGIKISEFVHGPEKDGGHDLTFDTKGPSMLMIFCIVSIEEIIFRGFFLGILPKIPILSGNIAFYVLFLVSNTLFALVHLSNYKNPKDRKVLRTLPQFLGGIFYIYLFVKYNLLIAIIGHFIFDLIGYLLSRGVVPVVFILGSMSIEKNKEG